MGRNNSKKVSFISNWFGQSTGLIVMAASLCAVLAITYLLFIHLHERKVTQIRSQGLELAQLISEIPYYQLVPNEGHRGTLELIKYNKSDPHFAYGAIVNTKGELITSAAISGIIIPKLKPPNDPSNWLAEKKLTISEGSLEVIEFHAPLIEKGELLGYVRLGFHVPKMGITSAEIPFLASITLPVFLIAALFLYLIRREIRPLMNAGEKLTDLVNQGSFEKVNIRASGELSGFISKFNDFVSLAQSRISELESNKNDLSASSKLLGYRQSKIESVLHALPEAVIVFDETGNVSFVNSKVASFLNISIDTIKNEELSAWSVDTSVVKYIQNIKKNPTSSYPSERLEISPDHLTNKHIALKSYPLFSPKDTKSIYGTLLLFQDITEEYCAKNARGEFVAHVAHELKTPLNVLAMYSETLQREEGQSIEFRTEAVNVISDEVERISMLINNLLSITKIEMGSLNLERQHVKLHDLLVDIFETIKRTARSKEIDFQIDIPKEMSPLYIDKDLLRIAINNLLTNAVKYSEEKGTVKLSAEQIDNSIVVRVKDAGIGITEEEQAHIFDKFYRSNDQKVRDRTGHGLGLSLARDIVQLHHGTLKVDSQVGQGSEFFITLENNSSMLERAV